MPSISPSNLTRFAVVSRKGIGWLLDKSNLPH